VQPIQRALSLRLGRFPVKVTCSTLGTVFKRDRSDWVLASDSELSGLSKLCQRSDVYLITEVNSDEQEEYFKNLLRSSCLIQAGLDPLKILFCSSQEGRRHMVRQLEPALHIDANEEVATNLQPYIAELVVIVGDALNGKRQHTNGHHNDNIWKFKSLTECFG